jgi:hypothetical protein
MVEAQGVALRSFVVEDEGDAFHVVLIVSVEQVGGALIQIAGRHPDEAMEDALAVGQGFVNRNAVT